MAAYDAVSTRPVARTLPLRAEHQTTDLTSATTLHSPFVKPNVFQRVGALFRLVRQSYTRDIARIVTSPPTSELRQSYHDGLVFVGCFVSSFVVIWAIILIAIKLYGEPLGCAAGFAFRHTSTISGRQSSETSASNDDAWEGDRPSGGSALTREVGRAPYPSLHDNDDKASTGEEATLSRRESTVQACFFLFGVALLVSVILIFSLAFNPLVRATNESSVFIEDSQLVLNETAFALADLSNASESSLDLVTSMEMNVTKLCPNVTSIEVETALGVDLESLLLFLNADYKTLAAHVSANVSNWKDVLDSGKHGISTVKGYFDLVNRLLWVIPTVLIALCFSTIFALTGCYMSRTRHSTRQFQRFLSFGVLPVLVLLALLCWLATMAASVLASVGSDACLADTSSGSPDETILNALLASNVNASSLLYAYTTDFTTGCNSSRASAFIPSLQAEVQTIIDFIEESLSKVEAVGLANLAEYCASGDDLGVFLTQAAELTRGLPFVQRALGDASQALSCHRIHGIYDYAVNETICVTLAGSVAWSFILFLLAGISAMGMVTLRSAWHHELSDDVIYEENDIAENMIFDEHEEYLLYISKYKHEWEEYQGVHVAPVFEVGSTGSLDSASSAPPNEDLLSVQDSHFDDSIAAFSLESGVGDNRTRLCVSNSEDTLSQSTVSSRTRSVNASVAEMDHEFELQASFPSQTEKGEEKQTRQESKVIHGTVFTRQDSGMALSFPSLSASEDGSEAMLIVTGKRTSKYRMMPSLKARKQRIARLSTSPRNHVLSCKRADD